MANANVDEAQEVMKPILGQQLWKWTLAAGLLTTVLGGIVLAWDNVDAPITVGARTQFGAQWQATGPVGPSSCGSPQATCTKVLSLSIDDSGVQRILFDNDEATGMYFSQSL